jgi:hypothetical protein
LLVHTTILSKYFPQYSTLESFSPVHKIDNCKLHEQRTDVWHVLFGGDERIWVQLEKCLKLVDALWTAEERQLCITKKVDDPKKFFLNMADCGMAN